MMLRLILKNFLSFDEEVQFDMFPNMKRTSLSSHISMLAGKLPVLKMAAIYGANGAGKSNLVKALEFIRAFALNKNFIKSIELKNFFYLLKEDAMKAPICLAIEFENQNRFFFYEIEISQKDIEKEGLYETFPLDNKVEPIFERKRLKVTFADSTTVDDAIVEATKKMLAKNPMASLLALNGEFPIVQDPRCKFAAKWFKGQLEIIGVHSFLPTLIDLLRDNKPMMEFARKLIYDLEVGVNDMNMAESDFDQWAKNHINLANTLPGDIDKVTSMSLNANNTPVLSISMEDGVRKVYQLMFDNIGKDGYVGHLDTSSQSDGTLRALTLLPALYYAKMGKTVVVDEINCCLSPTMVKGIVEFFSKTIDTVGQLIFTTHEEQLLDERDILRSDEIWFVDKKEGASIIYSHNDFKEHHTISPMRGYKEGRYGAIRYINLLQKNGQETDI
ncbi:MAG: AAA family ATPase [Paludibacteraceae bacterium]|nr:AAA family ATPase [Paludibacteraceae bacterium]